MIRIKFAAGISNFSDEQQKDAFVVISYIIPPYLEKCNRKFPRSKALYPHQNGQYGHENKPKGKDRFPLAGLLRFFRLIRN